MILAGINRCRERSPYVVGGQETKKYLCSIPPPPCSAMNRLNLQCSVSRPNTSNCPNAPTPMDYSGPHDHNAALNGMSNMQSMNNGPKGKSE